MELQYGDLFTRRLSPPEQLMSLSPPIASCGSSWRVFKACLKESPAIELLCGDAIRQTPMLFSWIARRIIPVHIIFMIADNKKAECQAFGDVRISDDSRKEFGLPTGSMVRRGTIAELTVNATSTGKKLVTRTV